MNIIDKLFRKWIRIKFLARKKEDLIILKILEAYITEKVLGGQEGRREELANMQRQIEENETFISFIKKI